MLVTLNRRNSVPLTDQIVASVRRLIEGHGLRQGARMPSIRRFAVDHGVSPFTVVQAYDRLVATGHLESRPGSGFFVVTRVVQEPGSSTSQLSKASDVMWLVERATEEPGTKYQPGCGWLPGSWQNTASLERGLRSLAQLGARQFVEGYGNATGYVPLRQDVQHQLHALGIGVELEQIMTTNGIAGALDLIGRYLITPGDTVLVDDPGTMHVFGQLHTLGATVIGVPWTKDGPDTDVLADLANAHKPRAFFTNTVLHNPTGCNISQSCAYRTLRLAEEHDFFIIEDDVYSDLQPQPVTRLAALDQLDRVIYVSGYSKTLSAKLRVGYLAARRELVRDLVDLKRLTCLCTPEVNERLVHQVLNEGQYRKHLTRLHKRLQTAREQTLTELDRCSLQVYVEPEHGMFVWARFDNIENSVGLSEAAAERSIMLAVGEHFRPNQEPSPWLRFNVAFCNAPEIFRFLEEVSQGRIASTVPANDREPEG